MRKSILIMDPSDFQMWAHTKPRKSSTQWTWQSILRHQSGGPRFLIGPIKVPDGYLLIYRRGVE